MLSPCCCRQSAEYAPGGHAGASQLRMHYRGKGREGEDMETVIERHPNTAGSNPQSTLIQAGRASGAAGSSEGAEMATFCGWPFGRGVGTAVRGFRGKEAWPSTEWNCSKLWWRLCGPMPSPYVSSQVSAGGQQRTGSDFGASVSCCRPSGVVTAPLVRPQWSDCFDVSLQYVLFVLFAYVTSHNPFPWNSSLALFPLRF